MTELIPATIKAVADAVAEGFRWAQTPEGIEFTKQMRVDRAAWDKTWANFGAALKSFFSGELFKENK